MKEFRIPLFGMANALERTALSKVSGAHQAADKVEILSESLMALPSGPKGPIDSVGFLGTTEVVPCYKAFKIEFFRSL